MKLPLLLPWMLERIAIRRASAADASAPPDAGTNESSPKSGKFSAFDASWPTLFVFTLLGAFTLSLTNTGYAMRAAILTRRHAPPRPVAQILPARPQVLVITTKRIDQGRIALTVNPRGYRVVVAENAAQVRDILQSNANRIGVVVLDTEMLDAEFIAEMARSWVPVAKLLMLPSSHAAAEVSKLLVDAI